MSFDLTKWALRGIKGLSLAENRVLATLCTYANDEGECYPKQTTISQECEMNKSNVSRIIKRLIEYGILVKKDSIFLINKIEKLSPDQQKLAVQQQKKLSPDQQKLSHSQPELSPDQHIKNKPINKPINKSDKKIYKKENYDLDFQEFWTAYPNKVGKPVSKSSFEKMRNKFPQSQIMNGLARYIQSKPPDRAWCNPSTFLNQERFNDEPSNPIQTATNYRTIHNTGAKQEPRNAINILAQKAFELNGTFGIDDTECHQSDIRTITSS